MSFQRVFSGVQYAYTFELSAHLGSLLVYLFLLLKWFSMFSDI